MAERRHGAKAPPTGATVSGANWSDKDTSGETHERVAFVDLDLTEVVNTGATFSECTFRRARFNASVHTDAAFMNCTFTNCNFFDAQFHQCKLVGSMFDRCTFEITKVVGGNWSLVGLPAARLLVNPGLPQLARPVGSYALIRNPRIADGAVLVRSS